MDTEAGESEKARRAKIMQFMNPRQNGTRAPKSGPFPKFFEYKLIYVRIAVIEFSMSSSPGKQGQQPSKTPNNPRLPLIRTPSTTTAHLPRLFLPPRSPPHPPFPCYKPTPLWTRTTRRNSNQGKHLPRKSPLPYQLDFHAPHPVLKRLSQHHSPNDRPTTLSTTPYLSPPPPHTPLSSRRSTPACRLRRKRRRPSVPLHRRRSPRSSNNITNSNTRSPPVHRHHIPQHHLPRSRTPPSRRRSSKPKPKFQTPISSLPLHTPLPLPPLLLLVRHEHR